MRVKTRSRLVFAAGVLFLVAVPARAQERMLHLAVDAREAPRKILHARLLVPAAPGPLTLVYPKWIPGEHAPTGPITDLAGLEFSAGGRKLEWARDEEDMYALHVTVPSGANEVEVSLDFLSPTSDEGYSSAASATAQLLMLSWNQVVLYPKGWNPDDVAVRASLHVPEGWKHATALPEAETVAGEVRFAPASLTTLVDSPVLMGRHFKEIPLSPGKRPAHYLDLACDSDAGLAVPPASERALRRLVSETLVLFGSHHYRQYRFLVTLSDHVAHFGLEHHESSDDRTAERTWIDDGPRRANAGLLSHEMVHSWNGKYRRPADLATTDFQQAQRTDLLWVYEGLTNYLGWVLSARSGLASPQDARADLARAAAALGSRAGRAWRPLRDTAVAAQLLYGASAEWASWRRGTDFYDEGTLLWLEVDTILRARSGGRRSIEDFCRAFCGGKSGPPQVVPYTFDDLVRTLEGVVAYDWRGFFERRVNAIAPQPPLGGIEAAGWKLAYSDTLPDYQSALDGYNKRMDLRSSIGLRLDSEGGEIVDVVPGRPAAEAGVAPGMKLLAVNGRKWSEDVVRDALTASKKAAGPLELTVENGEYLSTYRLDYHGGGRYPVLLRDRSKPDVLSRILSPRTPAR